MALLPQTNIPFTTRSNTTNLIFTNRTLPSSRTARSFRPQVSQREHQTTLTLLKNHSKGYLRLKHEVRFLMNSWLTGSF